MKKGTMKKGILIILAMIIFLGVISSNVFATGVNPVILPGVDSNATTNTTNNTTYTVTFNTNGGSIVSSQTVTSGEKATKPATDPTREGYTFDGWYVDSTFTTKFTFEEAITANTTVYAKWSSSASVAPSSVVSPTPTATTKTTNQDEKLPQTGDASDYAIFALIGAFAVVSVVAFVKVKKYNLK